MSLLFHMLSRFVIAFLPRSTCLLISWLQSPSGWWIKLNFNPLNFNGLKLSQETSQTLSTLEPAPQGPAYEEEPDGAILTTVPASEPL